MLLKKGICARATLKSINGWHTGLLPKMENYTFKCKFSRIFSVQGKFMVLKMIEILINHVKATVIKPR
jgi:hypothetical protein